MKRESISKKLRFEVFKRDSFTCQYCGAKAPDVILEIDHIKPISKLGVSEILNLITACKECNSGKSNIELSDDSILKKQHKQLSLLQERREQIEMMLEWKNGLNEFDNYIIETLVGFWTKLIPCCKINDNGKGVLKTLLKTFSCSEIINAMQISSKQYIQYENEIPTKESIERAFQKIGGICAVEKSGMREIYYIRGILKNRLSYFQPTISLGLLKNSVKIGASIEVLKKLALDAKSWTDWKKNMDIYIESLKINKL